MTKCDCTINTKSISMWGRHKGPSHRKLNYSISLIICSIDRIVIYVDRLIVWCICETRLQCYCYTQFLQTSRPFTSLCRLPFINRSLNVYNSKWENVLIELTCVAIYLFMNVWCMCVCASVYHPFTICTECLFWLCVYLHTNTERENRNKINNLNKTTSAISIFLL